MSTTVEVTPAGSHNYSRRRFLVLIPLLPAIAALAVLAVVPLSVVNPTDASAQAPASIAYQSPLPEAPTPAITASPSPTAASAEIFTAPQITIQPPPAPAAPKSGGRRSGHVVTAGPCSAAGITTTSVSSAPYSSYEQENLAYLNQARSDAGLGSLSWSGSLAAKARAWAVYLADNNCTGSQIGHSTIWTNGENVYWISGGSGADLALRAHNAFMNSSGHRANILRSWFNSVGIGIAHSSTGWYLVQNFSA